MGWFSRRRTTQQQAAAAAATAPTAAADAPTEHETGYVKLMIIFGLPLTDPAEEQNTQPGMIVRGDWSRIVTIRPDQLGYPYGAIPRLIVLWLARRARETGSPVIDLGTTPQQFVHELGLPATEMSNVLWQAQRLFGASITLGDATVGKNAPTTVSLRVAESFRFWDGVSGQVTLAEHLFASITEHAMPLDWEAVKGGRLGAMAIDVYAWLSLWARDAGDTGPERFAWGRLHELFGHHLPMEAFREQFATAVAQVTELVPAASLELTPDGALAQHAANPAPAPQSARRG
jgi:hypothetical protein